MFEEIAQDEDKRGSDANYEIAANRNEGQNEIFQSNFSYFRVRQ